MLELKEISIHPLGKKYDLSINEWNSIAKILVKGFTDTKYFPFQFCKAFIIHDLFGEVNNDCFIKSSLN